MSLTYLFHLSGLESYFTMKGEFAGMLKFVLTFALFTTVCDIYVNLVQTPVLLRQCVCSRGFYDVCVQLFKTRSFQKTSRENQTVWLLQKIQKYLDVNFGTRL